MIYGEPIMLGGGESASIFCTGDVLQTDTVTATKGSKTKNGKWVARSNPSYHNLPSGYTEVEYIESSGAQYIVSNLYGQPNLTIEVVAEFTSILSTARTSLVGYYNDTSQEYWELGAGGESSLAFAIRSATGNTTAKARSSSTVTLNTKYTVKGEFLSGSAKLYVDDTLEATASTNSALMSNPLNFFTWKSAEGDGYGKKIYSITAKLNGTLTNEYIPCQRDSDDVYGLYDTVTDTFFTTTVGTFTAGDEVPQYIYGFEISNINEYGTWTVTATNGTITETQQINIDMAEEYEWEYDLSYFTEAELVSMGCRVSRTVGDKFLCGGRYAQRTASNPYVVIKTHTSVDSGYIGYGIISNEPITETFTVSSYGEMVDLVGDGFEGYSKRQGAAWAASTNYPVYLNSSTVTYEILFNASGILSSYVDIANKIARSVQAL